VVVSLSPRPIGIEALPLASSGRPGPDLARCCLVLPRDQSLEEKHLSSWYLHRPRYQSEEKRSFWYSIPEINREKAPNEVIPRVSSRKGIMTKRHTPGSLALYVVACPDFQFLLCAKTRRSNTERGTATANWIPNDAARTRPPDPGRRAGTGGRARGQGPGAHKKNVLIAEIL
jgi:hypothetical protein